MREGSRRRNSRVPTPADVVQKSEVHQKDYSVGNLVIPANTLRIVFLAPKIPYISRGNRSGPLRASAVWNRGSSSDISGWHKSGSRGDFDMGRNRHTVLWVALGLFATPVVAIAQNITSPNLPASSDILGSNLIAWSEQQRPQPVPPANALDPQKQNPSATANAQRFRGTVMRDRSGELVLQISENRVYRLDDQGAAKLFEGKSVVAVATVVDGVGGLHVLSIQ
jgi:hypothetical protein